MVRTQHTQARDQHFLLCVDGVDVVTHDVANPVGGAGDVVVLGGVEEAAMCLGSG
jgi:hypothetical protein